MDNSATGDVLMRADLDEPTYASPEWQRRHGELRLERAAQVGVPHERTPEPVASEPMRWTAAAPTAPGWYWTRVGGSGSTAVPVYVFGRGVSLYALDSDGARECDVRGLWRWEWSSFAIAEPVE